MKTSILVFATALLAMTDSISAAAVNPAAKRDTSNIIIDQYSGATCQQKSNQAAFSSFYSGITSPTGGDLNDWPRSVQLTLPPTADGCFEVTMTDSYGETVTWQNQPGSGPSEQAMICNQRRCTVCGTPEGTGPDGPSWVHWAADDSWSNTTST